MTFTLFISDLHLHQEQPETARLFFDFMVGPAKGAESLYILGDLFDAWAGDDDISDEFNRQVIQSIHQLVVSGTLVFVMHGNRDFLLGNAFEVASGATLINDPWQITLHGKRAVLTHGDELCTDDVEYQVFRQTVRNPAWQTVFLAKPLAERKAQIAYLRSQSELAKSDKSEAIMDVNAEAVDNFATLQNYPDLLIHGHTHRPAQHQHSTKANLFERIVLTDWHGSRGGYLEWSTEGYVLKALS